MSGRPRSLEKDKAGQPEDTHRHAPSFVQTSELVLRWHRSLQLAVVVRAVVAELAAPLPGLPDSRNEPQMLRGDGLGTRF